MSRRASTEGGSVGGWKHVRLDEIERRNAWIPIRDRLGIRAFGINAWVGEEPGDPVIAEHREASSGHEELYLVVSGRATFTVAGGELDAPAGTLVFVRDPEAERKAIAAEPATTVLAVGARPGEAFRVGSWEEASSYNREAGALAREQRYEEAAEVMRRGLREHPDNPTLLYNLACFKALGGDREEALEHLERAISLFPGFRDFARTDDDLDSIRSDERFTSLVAGEPNPSSPEA